MFTRKKFYCTGIRFECQGEGRCCASRGEETFVYLSFGDRKRLALFLAMTVEVFTATYTLKADGLVHLKEPGQDCLFLREGGCSVYEARPRQCRTWPFWPENMHPKTWERDVASFCPGIGKGRLYSPEEIEAIMERKMEVGGKVRHE